MCTCWPIPGRWAARSRGRTCTWCAARITRTGRGPSRGVIGAGVCASCPGPPPRGRGPGAQPAGGHRGDPVSAAAVLAAGPGRSGALAAAELAVPTARLAPGLDSRFLAEIGWDPAAQVIAPQPGHPLLRDTGTWTYATSAAAADAAGHCAVPGCGRQLSAAGRALCPE